MGNTVLQSAQLFSSGRLMMEDFESSAWLANEGWTVLNGNPVNTSAAAYVGTYSFGMDSSFPLVQKDMTGFVNPGNAMFISLMFYDDATQTTSKSTLFSIIDGAAKQRSFGVRNASSTTHYQVQDALGSWNDTGIVRTTGWHRIILIWDGVSSSFNTSTFDGVHIELQPDGSGLTAPLSFLQLGTFDTTGNAPYGYFDQLAIAINGNITLVAKNGTTPATASLWQPAAAPGSVDTLLAGPSTTLIFDASALNLPLNAYFTATPKLAAAGPRYTGDVFPAMFAGDVYNLNVIDLGRRAGALDPGDTVARADSQSVSGKNEGVIFNSRDLPSISISDLTNAQRLDLEAWWSWAKLSQSFSLAIDSGDMFWSQLSAASGTNTATLVSVTGLNKGVELRLRRFDRSYSEKKIVASISGNVVTFTKNLERSYSIGDVAVSGLYWPRVITSDKKFKVTLAEPRTKRWGFGLSAMENI